MEFLARVFKKNPQAWPSRYREALEEARALRKAHPTAPTAPATVSARTSKVTGGRWKFSAPHQGGGGVGVWDVRVFRIYSAVFHV